MPNKIENDKAREHVSFVAEGHLRKYLENTYAELLESRNLSKAWFDKYKEIKSEADALKAKNRKLVDAIDKLTFGLVHDDDPEWKPSEATDAAFSELMDLQIQGDDQ